MIKNILVPFDFSDHSIFAVKIAVDLALKGNSKIHLLHIIEGSCLNIVDNVIENNFKKLVGNKLFNGIDFEFIVRYNNIFHQIIEYEKEKNIDLIVIGSIKDDNIINSLSFQLKKNAKSPVLTVRSEFYRHENYILHEQNVLIEQSNIEITTKQKEITDSLNYAKRIQLAILPSEYVLKKYLKNYFIFYKPKDIVAGDFYWLEKSPSSTLPFGKGDSPSSVNEDIDEAVLFAACDCTGHGVPGAMVSVVCKNALNHAVRDYGLIDPGLILDKTRTIIINEFEKKIEETKVEEVKDGMDIALCSLEGNKLKYAGALNPLWIIRKGELLETKGDKQPIGKFDNPLPYTTHSFDLQKDDTIYIFSDGYVDQFGGEKNKKFKVKAFRELLLSIQNRNMEEQKILINEAFEAWKGELEQVDDICIIGVRI